MSIITNINQKIKIFRTNGISQLKFLLTVWDRNNHRMDWIIHFFLLTWLNINCYSYQIKIFKIEENSKITIWSYTIIEENFHPDCGYRIFLPGSGMTELISNLPDFREGGSSRGLAVWDEKKEEGKFFFCIIRN